MHRSHIWTVGNVNIGRHVACSMHHPQPLATRSLVFDSCVTSMPQQGLQHASIADMPIAGMASNGPASSAAVLHLQ